MSDNEIKVENIAKMKSPFQDKGDSWICIAKVFPLCLISLSI